MRWLRPLLILVLLLSVTFPLRFINLGYSEFQDDEKKSFIRLGRDETLYEFLIRQRKGPMQFFVSYIPYSITGDYRNEFAQRIPFAVVNVASVAVFYFLLRRLTKSELAAVFGTLLFSFNGFIVGFSRISQYQNLNLLFSLLSLWFYSDLKFNQSKALISSLLGTLFFCLSLLSHWDAIFYLVPTVYFLGVYIFNKEVLVKKKLMLVGSNIALGCLVLLPFLVSYIPYHFTNQASTDYFGKRVGLSDYSFLKHKFIFELYNPYFTLPVYATLLLIAAFFVKRNFIYWVWFILNLLLIRYFMAKPGTHIYNYVIPAIILMSLAVGNLRQKLKVMRYGKYSSFVGIFLVTLIISSTHFYQSYMIFVDHSVEYPWEPKRLFNKYETDSYVEKEVLTFGFPHFRNWKTANEVMVNKSPDCFYLSNEGKEISQIYIDLKYGQSRECMFVVEVRKPFISTRDGIRFAETSGKEPIYVYKRGDTTYLKVYQAKSPSI